MSLQGSSGPEGAPPTETWPVSKLDRIVVGLGANELVEMVGGFRFDMRDGREQIVRGQHVIHIVPKFRDMPMSTPPQIGTTVGELNYAAGALARRLTHELSDIGQPQISEADGTRLAEIGLRVATLTFIEGRDIPNIPPRGKFSELMPPQLIIAIFPNKELAKAALIAVADQRRVVNTIPPAFLFQQ